MYWLTIICIPPNTLILVVEWQVKNSLKSLDANVIKFDQLDPIPTDVLDRGL